MSRVKKVISAALILVLLTGCNSKIDLNRAKASVSESNSVNIAEDQQRDKAFNQPQVDTSSNDKSQSENKQADSTKKDSAKKEAAKQSASTNQTNTAKKIVAQAAKKPVQPPTPAVNKDIQKVELPVTPQPEQNNTPVNTQANSQQSISGIPSYNYEVNNYAEFYKAVYESLRNFESSIFIKLNNYENSNYSLKVIDDIEINNFDVDYGLKSVKAVLYTMGNTNLLNIQFQYRFSKDKLIAMRDSSETKAQIIIATVINSNMSDIQKEKAVHDYVVSHTAYDYEDYVNGTLPGEVFNAYGVLINGKAVCEGYSKAILMLLRMAGLEAKSVVGYGIDGTNKIPHAWNMVKINGVFTLLDSTWDDPVPDNKSQIYYNYFNVSQEQLLKDHQWDMSKYPKASAVPLQ